jgi:hypothetical protein
LLEDEGAVLACMAYVDLNPVRAKMATCLEESRLTSVHDRICAKRARLRLHAMEAEDSRKDAKTQRGEEGSRGDAEARRKKKAEPTDDQTKLIDEAREESGRDAWLCRFGNEIGEGRVKGFAPRDFVEGGTGGHTVLAMRFEDYVELLEWTGRCVVEGKQGSIPGAALPVLERMELEVENWVETVERYGSIYCRVAGKVENLKRKALELGQRWVSGQGKSRWVFRRKPKGGKAGEIPVAVV